MPLTITELESKLWGAADILRGQIDSSDYKNFIFSVLFLKRLSDRFDEEVDSAVRDGLDRGVAEQDHDEHEFFVPPEARWSEIIRQSMNLGEVLNRASAEIEEANAPRLDGVLFRGGAEGTIRKGILEADLFEAVIGLAPNLFYGASIPVAICVFNKAKPAERRGKVLFIDAAQPDYFRSGKAQNFLDPAHVASIVEAFRSYEEAERFAHVADLDEVEANDHNLNISRYVDTTEPVEVMSVEDALTQLREAERKRDEAAAHMNELLAGLGYAPDG